MHIRKYEAKDFEQVRRVCRETCTDKWLLEHDKVLLTKYADYYTETHPEHIWVLADESDTLQGYLLCCPDPEPYRKTWKTEYSERIKGNGVYAALLKVYSMLEVKRMARLGYPAHLHIDISPAYQRGGAGFELMTCLLNQLKAEGIPGVYLGCAVKNKAGNAFYKKYGFKLLKSHFGENIYVYHL